ncbi:MAG: hypothetical protein WCO96_01345 [Actinomycetes bacterium]
MPARIPDADLRVLHRAYLQGHSLRALGAAVWERYGYSSTKSAANAIHAGFVRLKLPRRDKAAMMAERNRVHGQATRDGDRDAYRRWRRRQTGEVRGELCNAVRQQYPRKGAQCRNMALAESDYCFAHDPDRAEERDRILTAARSQIA